MRKPLERHGETHGGKWTAEYDVQARILAPYGKPIVHAFEKPLPEQAWAKPISEAIAALEATW